MRLLNLSAGLMAIVVAIASCRPAGSAIGGDAVVVSPNRTDAAESKREEGCLDLNIATAEELMKLPGVGEVMAGRIISYRERHGRFRRAEEIIIIEGFSERRFRAIAEMICVEGAASE